MTLHPRHAFDVIPGEPQPTLFTPLAQFFRRALRTPWRKPAPEGVASGATPTTLLASRYPCCVHCASGSPCDPRDSHLTPCSDGCGGAAPVLGQDMLADVRAEWDRAYPRPTLYPRPDGDVIVGQRNEVTVRPVNGRNLGTLPRRKPELIDRGPGKPPWQTQEMPALYRNGWQ